MSAPGAMHGASPDAAVTVDDVIRVVRRIWRPVVAAGLAGAVLGVVVGLVRPKSYVAQAAFVAEQSKLGSLPSGIGSLAAQFGLDIAADAGRSPLFYRDLLTTAGLLTSLLDSVVPVTPGESLAVRQLLRGDSGNARRNVDRLLRRFRTSVAAGVDQRTSVVSFGVRTRTPLAAEGVAYLLINAVKRFNISTRQLQARERRLFLERRVSAAQAALLDGEGALRNFYMRNRRFSESPDLVFEETRLKRVIDLRQEIYTTLSKELETSRIQEVNDTPTITIVDRPYASSRPAGPGLKALAAAFSVVGAGLMTAWLITRTRA